MTYAVAGSDVTAIDSDDTWNPRSPKQTRNPPATKRYTDTYISVSYLYDIYGHVCICFV